VDSNGRTIWIADAHRGNGKRFVVHAEEKLTAFLELKSAIRPCPANYLDKLARSFRNSPDMKTRIPPIVITFAFVCFGLLPQTQAQLPPEIPGNPDGCYPAFTTAEGCNALHQLLGGIGNTAVGWYSNFLAGDANFNTSVGAGTLALDSGIGAGQNTAIGTAAMILNLSGSGNTAVGSNALVFNTIASDNTAVGRFALYNNDSSGADVANGNNAFGAFALFSNIDGNHNCAFGDNALTLNTDSFNNTAVGAEALVLNDSTDNATANNNTAVGWRALRDNINAGGNTAVGPSRSEIMTTPETTMPPTTRQLAFRR